MQDQKEKNIALGRDESEMRNSRRHLHNNMAAY